MIARGARVLCAGATLGTLGAVRAYLDAMTDELSRLRAEGQDACLRARVSIDEEDEGDAVDVEDERRGVAHGHPRNVGEEGVEEQRGEQRERLVGRR